VLESKKRYSIDDIQKLIPTASAESIFIILRHLISNNTDYAIEGDWSTPTSLEMRKNN